MGKKHVVETKNYRCPYCRREFLFQGTAKKCRDECHNLLLNAFPSGAHVRVTRHPSVVSGTIGSIVKRFVSQLGRKQVVYWVQLGDHAVPSTFFHVYLELVEGEEKNGQ